MTVHATHKIIHVAFYFSNIKRKDELYIFLREVSVIIISFFPHYGGDDSCCEVNCIKNDMSELLGKLACKAVGDTNGLFSTIVSISSRVKKR